jgi:Flp pilus assembly protein TadG
MKRDRERGQAVIETALVLPVILAMILGVFSLGSLFSTQLIVTNASREGARLGALGRPESRVRDTVKGYLAQSGLKEQPQIAVTTLKSADGDSVNVDVTYPVQLLFTIPGVPNPVMLNAAAVMRVEQ